MLDGLKMEEKIMNKNYGFTLAEVLITLAIIGIVATLTIPTMIQNFQTRAWNTASTVFERKLEEALKVMNTQAALAGYKTTEDFVNELSKHMKITKICKTDDMTSCFEDKVYWGSGDTEPAEVDMTTIKTAKNFGQDEWDTETIGVQFANGTNAVIAYNPNCKQEPYSNQVKGTSCIAILYDTSAYKNPNTSGKDLRGINVKKLGSNCVLELSGICFSVGMIDKPMTMAECNAEKDKLGIPNCCNGMGGFGGDNCGNDDYYGAAIRACGGINHLPSVAQLNVLGKYLYNDNFRFIDNDYYNWLESQLQAGKTEEELMQEVNKIYQSYTEWNDERVAASGLPIISQDGMSALFTYTNNPGRYSFQAEAAIFTNYGEDIGITSYLRKHEVPSTLCVD